MKQLRVVHFSARVLMLLFYTLLNIGYMFCCASVRPCIQHYMLPGYLQYLSMDFCQTFVVGASWDKDELISFVGQKVKGQGHIIAIAASSLS